MGAWLGMSSMVYLDFTRMALSVPGFQSVFSCHDFLGSSALTVLSPLLFVMILTAIFAECLSIRGSLVFCLRLGWGCGLW